MGLKLDMIGIVVEDIKVSLAFYRLLGIEIPEPAEGEDHVEVTLGDGLRLAWDSKSLIKEIDPHWVEPTGQRMGMAFLCETPAEVDATYSQLLDAGHIGKLGPWDAFWGQRYAIVLDPDGNEVSLFAWQSN